MRSMRTTKPAAFVGLALLALGLVAAAPRVSRAADTPWLGVTLQALDEGLRDGMGYDGEGVLVNRVMEGSPADRAGLRKGDVIVSLNGRPAESPEQLTRLVQDARVGQTVSLAIVRDGDRRTISARLASRPSDADVPVPGEGTRVRRQEPQEGQDRPDMDDHGEMDHQGGDMEHQGDTGHPDMGDLEGMKDMKDLGDLPGMNGRMLMMNGLGRGRLGVRAEDLSEDLAPYFDAPAGGGALVMEVLKDTPAERAGLRAGDVVVRVGEQRISSSEDLIRAMREAPAGRTSVTVLRHGSRRTFQPELEAAPRFDGRRGGALLGPNGPGGPAGPGNGRVIIRDRNGTRVYQDQDGRNRDEEMQRLRDEVRRLRQQLNEQRKQEGEDEDKGDDGQN